MIGILQKIRKYGVGGRKFFLYAFGEVVLIVFGILIASKVNDWNERINNEEQFKSIIEQIYNAAHTDWENGRNAINIINEKLEIIDHLLNSPDSISDRAIALMLFNSVGSLPIQSDVEKYLPYINYRTDKPEHREIITEITSYTTQIFWSLIGAEGLKIDIPEFLVKKNVHKPATFGGSSDLVESVFWDKNEYAMIRSLIKSNELRTLLKNARSDHIDKLAALNLELNQSQSLVEIIRKYSPSVRLLFKDIGIIGSALPTGWEKSIPMKLVDPKKCIWEIEVLLKNGVVKFRSHDSWKQNWGGKGFPSGETIFDGGDISVKEGNYKIELNILEGKYEFVLKDK